MKDGRSDGFKSFLMVRVTTVGRGGTGVGAGAGGEVGSDAIMQVRVFNVSPMTWSVLSIFSSLLAMRSSSCASRDSEVSADGNEEEG